MEGETLFSFLDLRFERRPVRAVSRILERYFRFDGGIPRRVEGTDFERVCDDKRRETESNGGTQENKDREPAKKRFRRLRVLCLRRDVKGPSLKKTRRRERRFLISVGEARERSTRRFLRRRGRR